MSAGVCGRTVVGKSGTDVRGRWGKDHNTVTLVGTDKDYIESLVKEVEEGIKGTRITVEGEDEAEEPKADGEAPASGTQN